MNFIEKLILHKIIIFCFLGEDDSYLYLVLVTACRSVGKIKNSEISCITSTVFIALGAHDEVGISEVRKLLNSGSFYFALSMKENEAPLDLTLTYQRQYSSSEPDNRFFWYVALNYCICTGSFCLSCEEIYWLSKYKILLHINSLNV